MIHFRQEQLKAMQKARAKAKRKQALANLREQGYQAEESPETGEILVQDKAGGKARLIPDGSDYLLEDSRGKRRRYTYNDRGLLTSCGPDDSAAARFTYDDNDRMHTVGLGQRIPYLFVPDDKGRMAEIHDPNGAKTRYRYDGANRVTGVIDRMGGETVFGYTPFGQLATVTNPEGGRTAFAYIDDQPTSVVFPNQQRYDFRFTDDGKLSAVLAGGEPYAAFDLEKEGEQRIDYADGSFLRLRLAEGRIVEAENENGTVELEYDDAGRLQTERSGGHEVVYQRNELGAVTAIMCDGGEPMTYDRDGDGRIVSACGLGGAPIDLAWDGAEALASVDYPNGLRLNRTATETGMPASQNLVGVNGAVLQQLTWAYDDMDRVTGSVDAGRTESYAYDAEGRLTGITNPDGTVHFQLDGNGNRLTDAMGEASFDNGNRMLAHTLGRFDYDLRGNTTTMPLPNGLQSHMRYNGRNQLIEIATLEGPAHYEYDALGRRIRKRVGSRTITYVWAGLALLTEIEEGPVPSRTDYLFLPDAPVCLSMRKGSALFYFHHGRRMEPISVTDAKCRIVWQAAYDAFGQATLQIGMIEQPLRLPGQYWDRETGLHFNHARYYNPQFGRFLTMDPLLQDGGSWNFYLYCGGDPLNRTDPSGEFIFTAIVVGALIGAAIGGGIEAYRQHKAIEAGEQEGWDIGGIVKSAAIGGLVGAVGGGVGVAVEAVAVTAGAGILAAGGLSGGVTSVAEQCTEAMLTGDWPSPGEFLTNVVQDAAIGTITAGMGGWVARKFRKLRGATDDVIPPKSSLEPKNQCNKGCGFEGEPVFVVTGANMDAFDDLVFGVDEPLFWRRYYNSSQAIFQTGMGRGFRHEYSRLLEIADDAVHYIDKQGTYTSFPLLQPGDLPVTKDGLILQRDSFNQFSLRESGEPDMVFYLPDDGDTARLVSMSRNSHTWQLGYGTGDRLEYVSKDGNALMLSYDEQGLIAAVSLRSAGGAAPAGMRYAYNEDGCLIQVSDQDGHAAEYAYSPQHQMIAKGDYNGYYFHYEYDILGRCIRTAGQDGLFHVNFKYMPEAQYTVVAYADGSMLYYLYDQNGTITEIIDPMGGTTERVIDESGRVVAEVDPTGNTLTYLYDSTGAYRGRADAMGNSAPAGEPVHGPAHQVPQTADAWLHGLLPKENGMPSVLGQARGLPAREQQGFQRKASALALRKPEPPAVYDHRGKVMATGSQDKRTTYAYDPNGNRTAETDPDGDTRYYHYGSWNLLVGEEDALGNMTQFGYGIRSQVAQVIDPGGSETQYVYDAADRLTEVYRHGILRERYSYDEAGHLVGKMDGRGNNLLQFEIGDHGLKTLRELESGERHFFDYDDRGRITKAETDDFSCELDYEDDLRAADKRDGLGVDHQYEGGRLVKTEALSRYVTRYAHKGQGLIEVTDPTGRKHRIKVGKEGMILRELDNGLSELSCFDGDKLQRQTTFSRRGGKREHRQAYTWSPGGRLLSVSDNLLGDRSFQYDAAHRLVGRSGAASTSYSYDAAGNLLTGENLERVSLLSGNRLASANGESFTYNHRNHIASRSNGAHTTVYRYDSREMLVEAEVEGKAWTAVYDPLGRRVSKAFNGKETRFYWDGDRLAAEETDRRTRVYVYPDGVALVPFMFVDYTAGADDQGKPFYIHTNQIGTPIRVTNESGHEVWRATLSPYGEAAVSTGNRIELNLRMPGHYFDPETGLHYNRFRYYDPRLGRYLQSDPLGLEGGINLYAYPANPLSDVDVVGLQKCGGKTGSNKQNTQDGPDVEQPPKEVVEEPGKRGGWNKKLNKELEPNTTYDVDGRKYHSDSQGRINKVEGELTLKKRDRNTYQQTKSGGEAGIKDGRVDDEGGHLLASIFDGPGEQINYAPMNSNLNRGKWKAMENSWAGELKKRNKVQVEIKPKYRGDSKRPSSFEVDYVITDATTGMKTFKRKRFPNEYEGKKT